MEGTADVLLRWPRPLRLAVHSSPAADDALDVLGSAGAPDSQQPLFGLGRRHPRQRTDLGVGELAARERLGESRQRGRARATRTFSRAAPRSRPTRQREPLGAGAKAGIPAVTGIELADEIQQASGRRLEMRGELGDLVAQAVQLRDARRRGLQNEGTIDGRVDMASPPFLLGRL